MMIKKNSEKMIIYINPSRERDRSSESSGQSSSAVFELPVGSSQTMRRFVIHTYMHEE